MCKSDNVITGVVVMDLYLLKLSIDMGHGSIDMGHGSIDTKIKKYDEPSYSKVSW